MFIFKCTFFFLMFHTVSVTIRTNHCNWWLVVSVIICPNFVKLTDSTAHTSWFVKWYFLIYLLPYSNIKKSRVLNFNLLGVTPCFSLPGLEKGKKGISNPYAISSPFCYFCLNGKSHLETKFTVDIILSESWIELFPMIC